MTILCMLTSLFEFVVLLALTGALVSIVALLHLMGLFISIITPLTTFLLNQSGRLVICGTIHSKRLTARAYRKAFHRPEMVIRVQTQGASYDRGVVPDLVEDSEAPGEEVSAEPVITEVDENGEKESEEVVEEVTEEVAEEEIEEVAEEETEGETMVLNEDTVKSEILLETEEQTGEEPSAEEPSGEEPSGEEPSGEEPSGEEPNGEEAEEATA